MDYFIFFCGFYLYWNMKGIFFVVSTLFMLASSDIFGDLMSGVEDIGKSCIPQVGASLDDLNDIMNHKVPSSSPGKCLVACIQKDFGIQTENGELNKEGAMKSIAPLKDADVESYNKLKSIFDKCLEEVHHENDECETGAKFKQCIIDNLN